MKSGGFTAHCPLRTVHFLSLHIMTHSLRENRPNVEFFLVRILLYSVRMQKNMEQKKMRFHAYVEIMRIFRDNLLNPLLVNNSMDVK